MRSSTRAPAAVALSAAALLAVAPAAWAATVVGTPGDDVLTGTELADSISGGGGADELFGLGGRDRLFGQAGVDVLDGGDGADSLNGGDGADVLKGGAGSDVTTLGPGDTAWAGDDRDYFRIGTAGDWLVHGGPGDDYLDVQVGGLHTVYGDDGDDVLDIGTMGAAASRAFGGGGADQVLAAPDDYELPLMPVALLSGGAGNDALWGFATTLDGGGGNDEITSAERTGEPRVSTIRCGAGVDSLTMHKQPTGPLDTFGADCENVGTRIWAYGDADQTLVGTVHADDMSTGDGDDTVSAGAGNDVVDTSWGSDTVDLGAGDDSFANWSTHAYNVDVDRVDCGPGNDYAAVYRSDIVVSCETVNYR
ncbi:MAG: Alkaline phosphatase [uncultured Nocardioidaceae bacterium]|uniref:Alkaline phosphatase n=1 Tax=uncultured Nocardioidaceae bacterium TaxID=253824 RepID=A0A6J4LKT4_9ACTN|nr:MAG: Alkaline phosphatase [uncultured Nocardioidaceae bacterium]